MTVIWPRTEGIPFSTVGSSQGVCSTASRTSTAFLTGYRAMNEREAIKVMIQF
jgi:hypothetical protein